MREQNKAIRKDPDAPRLAKIFLSRSGDTIPFILSHQLESDRILSLQDNEDKGQSSNSSILQTIRDSVKKMIEAVKRLPLDIPVDELNLP